MTTLTKETQYCDRCDQNLERAAVRACEDGGPMECPKCGLEFDFSAEWLRANGYEEAAEAMENPVDDA